MGALTSLWGLRSNGEEFPIEASISKMNTNGDKLFTAIVRDITERLKSAEALRRSDVTRMMALDSARLGDWQLDLQTGAATRSLLHDEIFGYTDKQPSTSVVCTSGSTGLSQFASRACGGSSRSSTDCGASRSQS